MVKLEVLEAPPVASWCPSHPIQMMDKNQFAVIFILLHVTGVVFRNNQKSLRPCQFQRTMEYLMAISFRREGLGWIVGKNPSL